MCLISRTHTKYRNIGSTSDLSPGQPQPQWLYGHSSMAQFSCCSHGAQPRESQHPHRILHREPHCSHGRLPRESVFPRPTALRTMVFPQHSQGALLQEQVFLWYTVLRTTVLPCCSVLGTKALHGTLLREPVFPWFAVLRTTTFLWYAV